MARKMAQEAIDVLAKFYEQAKDFKGKQCKLVGHIAVGDVGTPLIDLDKYLVGLGSCRADYILAYLKAKVKDPSKFDQVFCGGEDPNSAPDALLSVECGEGICKEKAT